MKKIVIIEDDIEINSRTLYMDNRDWNYFDISRAAYFRKKAYKKRG